MSMFFAGVIAGFFIGLAACPVLLRRAMEASLTAGEERPDFWNVR